MYFYELHLLVARIGLRARNAGSTPAGVHHNYAMTVDRVTSNANREVVGSSPTKL